MIHRTRQGKPPSGGPEPGRKVIEIGDIFVEYSGPAPTQADLDKHFAPPDPVMTPATTDDLVRALITKGTLTQADIDDAKRGRP